jgi:hypothetical protein
VDADQVELADPEQPDELQYRAVSPLAVVAVLAGIASAVALLHPVLWFVPLVAIGLAVAALRSVARSPDTLVGRKAALAAMGLAVFFGSFAPARVYVQRSIISSRAREFAEMWLTLVQDGELQEAFQWSLSPDERVTAGVDLEQFYQSNPEQHEAFSEYFRHEPLSILAEWGARGQIEFIDNVSTMGGVDDSVAIQDYRIVFPRDDLAPLAVRLHLGRTISRISGEPSWRVFDVIEPGSGLH